ncbi:MAG: hypothetical protein QOF67_3446 [Mycobacterium sp.]|nr:hypothetical protein [Mycobacterium sp.]
MADTWELICHHTYSGTPGVVYDLSPKHESPGTAVDLADSDFLADGATAGSGAVRFDTSGALIRIPANKSWQPLDAVRAEVTLLLDPSPPGGIPSVSRLIDAGSVQFDIRSGGLRAWFISYPLRYSEVSTHLNGVVPNFQVPTGRWMTAGFLHDGFAVQELTLDGQVVARADLPLWPVTGAGDVTIGNAAGGGTPIRGLLDEVKVWRSNPRRTFEEFFDRPMDEATARCWADYLRQFAQWMRTHPDCARLLQEAVKTAGDSVVRQALTHRPHTRRRTLDTAKRYRRLWSAGELDSPAMAKLLADLRTSLRSTGAGPDTNPDVQALLDSDCLRQFLSEVGPPECDPAFLAMLRGPRSRN